LATKRAFDRALRENEKLLSNGLYYEDVRRYIELFGRDRLKVLLFEDPEVDTLGVIKDVYGYIGVDDQFQPNIWLHNNPGAAPASPFMREEQSVYRHDWRRRAMKAVVTCGMRRRLAGINHREVKTTALIFADIRKRLRGYYREDIIKLQNLIDWDLNA
jgi:hypothetical protein